jgi:hypothetical protein
MADSFMGIGGVLLVLGVVLFFVNPIIALVPLLLVVALLALKFTGTLFKHAAPSVQAGGGPATPSSADAAYDPVSDPSDRGA